MEFIEKYFLKQKMMRTVLIALLPVLIVSIYFQGLRVLFLTIVNIVFAILTEYIFEKKINKKDKISEAVLVTAVLYTMTLPVSLPVWMSVIGIIFGVFFGKMVFDIENGSHPFV